MPGQRLSTIFAALWLAAFCVPFLHAQEQSCAPPSPSPRLTDYRAVFLACVNDAGTVRLAIRRMRTDAEALLLTVDPRSLATRVEPERCWRCTETSDEAQSETRLLHALQSPQQAREPRAGRETKAVENAGLVHGESGFGAFVTGDLCPSRRPLDRGFFERLARERAGTSEGKTSDDRTSDAKTSAAGTPVALAVSGLWLARHAADLEWLKRQDASGALAITWVNHSYSHPYAKHRPQSHNFMLTEGLDFDREVYGTERLMIEAGLTPSIFFRFPGLISDAALSRRLRESHLVALGADAWLALGSSPRPGSIVLVHPNGNEPAGIKLLSHLLDHGRVPRPLRPIDDAPG